MPGGSARRIFLAAAARFFPVAVLFATFAGGAAAQIASAESPAVLTLETALAEAQQSNRLIKIASQSVLFSNDQILAAKTQRYPQFNVQLSGSGLLTPISITVPKDAFGLVNGSPVPAQDSTITTNPHFSAMSFIQISQPLSQLYSVHLNVELMKVGKTLSQEQLRQQRQEITNSVKEAYYGLLQTQSALDAANENVKALREMDRTTAAYLQEKTVLQYQSTGVKVQLAQAELQVVTLQDTFETQKENLNDLMGRDIRTDFTVSGVPEALPEEQSIELARASALANRTEIHQAVYARRLQKAQYIPEVGIQYLFFSPFTIQGFPSNVNSLGVSFKWDIFDWGNKRHLMDEKQRGIEQGQLNLVETRSQVTIDLDNRYRKLREARAGLKVAELSQQAEKENLEVVMEQYKQKAALLSALQTEQANMAQSAAQYQQALSNFWSARSEFEKALGED